MSAHVRTVNSVETLETRRLFYAPVTNLDGYFADEDISLVVDASQGLLANDFDPESDPFTAQLSSPPTHGTLNLNPDGSFDYTPEADYFGFDGFSYIADDGTGQSSITGVNLNINPVADPGKFSFTASEFFAAEQTGFGLVTVARTGGSEGFATVDYSTSPGTATEFSDYFPNAQTLFFFDGQVSQDIYISLVSDFQPELSETLMVTLSNPTFGATFAPGQPPQATLTIVNSDPPPSLTIADPAPTLEGNVGDTTVMPFVLSLSEPSVDPITLHYFFGPGSATAGMDFDNSSTMAMGGLVTFAPGETTATISVPVFGDAENEFDESVSINLFGANGALLADSSAFGSIVNDDNQLPTAADSTITRAPGGDPLPIDVSSLVTSPDGDVLTLSIQTQPTRGTIAIDKNGTPADAGDDVITYTPGGFGFGDDSFSYTVTDPYGGADSGTVTIDSLGLGVVTSPLDPTKTDLLIAGTSAADNVRFQKTKMPGEVRVIMNGADAGAFSPTGRIILATGAGDDIIDARGLPMNIEVFGGEGNDTIKGGRGSDMLYGGPGDDVLRGGEKRDILIGGEGKDTISGGEGADILIAGVTLVEGETLAAQQFRSELLAAWNADVPQAVKLTALAEGTLPNSGIFLASANVIDDGMVDVLTGNSGSDWLFGVSDFGGVRDHFNAEFGKDEFTEIA